MTKGEAEASRPWAAPTSVDEVPRRRLRSGFQRKGHSSTLEVRLHLPAHHQADGVAATVERARHGDLDPAFADAVFLDVVLFLAVEAYANAALQQLLVVELAARIDREAIGRSFGRSRGSGFVGHGA